MSLPHANARKIGRAKESGIDAEYLLFELKSPLALTGALQSNGFCAPIAISPIRVRAKAQAMPGATVPLGRLLAAKVWLSVGP